MSDSVENNTEETSAAAQPADTPPPPENTTPPMEQHENESSTNSLADSETSQSTDSAPVPLTRKKRSKSMSGRTKSKSQSYLHRSPSQHSDAESTDGDTPPHSNTGSVHSDDGEPTETEGGRKKKKKLKLIIGEVIGKGAAAEVHKAINEETGEVCAIKKMKKAGMKAEQLKAVALEIELSKQLKHPNIVDVKGSLEDKNYIFLILEYVDGGSLSSLLKQYGPYPPAMAAAFIKQVLKGLVYLHSQGVIHRDIKAANILLSNDGQIKLADFGVSAKLKSETEKRYTVVGTPYWMAPEVITMSGHSTASDIWSVGCTVLELLTGHPPYWDLDQMRAIFCVVQDAHPPLPENLPEDIKDFVLKCFEKDPAKRPTAEELLQHPWLTNNQLDSLVGQEANKMKVDYKSVRKSLKSLHKGSKKKRKTTSLDSVVNALPPSTFRVPAASSSENGPVQETSVENGSQNNNSHPTTEVSPNPTTTTTSDSASVKSDSASVKPDAPSHKSDSSSVAINMEENAQQLPFASEDEPLLKSANNALKRQRRCCIIL